MNSNAQPAPGGTPTPVRLMVSAESHPAAFASILDLDKLRDDHRAEGEAIKAKATEELKALNDRMQARHKDAWTTIERELGLDPERDHAVCTQHVADHGLAFVRDTDTDTDSDDEDGPSGGMPGGLGAMLAAALGGQVIAGGPTGGVIKVDVGGDADQG